MPYFFDRVKETTTTTGTGSITLAGAVTNFRTFDSVLTAGQTTFYVIEDVTNSAWEAGLGTYSGSNVLARTTRTASSTGSAINFGAGTKYVYIDVPASYFFATNNTVTDTRNIVPQFTPGGRLTLASGTPVTTSDQTSKSTIYYAPYVSNMIVLYDSVIGKAVMVPFTETSLALGTLTSAKNYDVFAYLSSGSLTLTAQAWSTDTARATALTYDSLQGYLVKSDNSALRFLGTFRTTSTTTTEDSMAKRFLWNNYNRVPRELRVYDSTGSWDYSTATWRASNNSTANQVAWVSGLNESPVTVRGMFCASDSIGASSWVGLNLDATTGGPATPYVGIIGGNGVPYAFSGCTIDYSDYSGLGYHFLQMMEKGGGAGTQTFMGCDANRGGTIISGTIMN